MIPLFILTTALFLALYIGYAIAYSYADARKEIYKILNVENLEKQRPQDLIEVFLKFSSVTRNKVFDDFKDVYVTLLHNYIWRMTGVKKAYGEVYFEQLLNQTLSLKDLQRKVSTNDHGSPVYDNPFSEKWAEAIYASYITKYGVRDLFLLEEQLQLACREYNPVNLLKEYTEIRAVIRKIEQTELNKIYCPLTHMLIDVIEQEINIFFSREEVIQNTPTGSHDFYTQKANILADAYIDAKLRARLKESFDKVFV